MTELVCKLDDRKTAGNSIYKKLAVQWINEALCPATLRDSVLADSFRLRNRQLLVAANRYAQTK